jgi:gluconate 2-dehydrogenase gamma chain
VSEALLFLNRVEARTVEAIAARIIPGDDDDPGAVQAGAVGYVDGALAGYHRDLQDLYRRSLRALDEHCRAAHGAPFAQLAPDVQDGVLAVLDAGRATGDGPAPIVFELFPLIRTHVIEGTFCDPAYGGNRDGVGWRMVGFPGARWEYTAEQMAPGFDATTLGVRTLADLRVELDRREAADG